MYVLYHERTTELKTYLLHERISSGERFNRSHQCDTFEHAAYLLHSGHLFGEVRFVWESAA